ncbi:MAG: amino-acid N-acetyltransferase [Gammaproteobacteria bacterium]
MDDSGQSFIQWFRQSAPYIHAHRNRTFVIQFGGEAVTGAVFQSTLHDVALLNSLGVRVVLVHGARPQIEDLISAQGGDSAYADGLRVTDDLGLEAAKEAAGRLRVEIEAMLSMGVANSPMGGARIRVASGNFVTARPLGVVDGQDFMHTGEVRRVDAEGIGQRLDAGDIVLLSPLGFSPTGEIFNLSAEDVAVAAASALKADKLLLLTETDSLSDSDAPASSCLTPREASALLERLNALAPLGHSLFAAIHACRNGVRRAHLLDHHVDGALMLELFTRDGIGTLVTSEQYEEIRPAAIEDVAGILALIAPLEDQGVLVRRSREQIELEINDFTVLDRDGLIAGCAALHDLDGAMAELACVAIHPDYRTGGRGDDLLEFIERRARDQGLSSLAVLTTKTAHWFRERGFVPGRLTDLPVQRQAMYNYQRNSKVFIKTLAPQPR